MRRMQSASNSGLGCFSSRCGPPTRICRPGQGRKETPEVNYRPREGRFRVLPLIRDETRRRFATLPRGQILGFPLSLSFQKDSLQKIEHLGCTIPSQGVLWPETCKLRAATVGRISPSALPISRSFQERGYSTPKRCKPCRQAKKNDQGGIGRGHRSAPSQGTPVICSGCGQPTTVPFEPRGDRPVYCRDCYTARKGTGGGGRR